ncbi:MAG TPA: mechanosensitive ion channel family protein [Gemmatimonadales bacterium]|jgi:small-conductance mechanosensitive channel
MTLRIAAAFTVGFLTLVASPSTAQETTAAVRPAGAAVIVRGDTLFRLTGALGPFSPEERARAIAARIDSLSRDPVGARRAITIADSGGGTNLALGSTVLMTVTDEDAAAAGVPRATLAAQLAPILQQAIGGARGSTFKGILLGALLTLLATGGFILLFRGMNRFFPWLYRKIDGWRTTIIPSIRIQRLEVLSAARAADTLVVFARGLRIAAMILLIYVYLPLVLGFFPWTADLSTTIFGWVIDPLQQAGVSFINYLPDIFTIAVIVAVVVYVLKFIHLFFNGIKRGAITFPGFYRDWAEPTYKIVRFAVLAFTAVVIVPYLPGSDSKAFQGVSVFLGVLFTFGSASAISNLVAGVVMTYMRPFQSGDRVKIAETVGDVVEKTLLVTRIRTNKNVDVTVPNAMVLSSHIINYSSSAKHRGVILHTGVTIGYDVPWRQVHQLLISAADKTEGVLAEPKAFVLQTGLDDFYVKYELNAYTDRPNAMSRTYSLLHQNIQDRFAEAGVEIMSPHYRAERDGNAVALPPAPQPRTAMDGPIAGQ